MAKFEAPKNIKELDDDALAKSIEDALAAISDVNDDSTDEELAEAEAVLEYINSARSESGAREQAAQERADRVARLKEAAKGSDEEDGDDEVQEEETQAPEVAEEQEVEKDAEIVRELQPAAAEVAEVAATGKTVKAAVRKPIAARVTKAQKEEQKPEKKSLISLTAAAEVSGYTAGHKFDSLVASADAVLSKLKSYPSERIPNMHMRNSALMIEIPSEFRQEQQDVTELLLQLSSEARLTGGSLTAAGGWGAPSEQLLDFCAPEQIDGLINLPEFTVTRPGVSYTRGPDFATVLGNATGYWDMTEATAEAGVEQKTSLRPDIPTFTEKRLDAVGVMMEAGLLLRQGWPELIARYEALLLKAHQYKMNQKKLAQIQAFTGAATTINNGFGNELDFLHVVELVAEGERQRSFLASGQTLEMLAPAWSRAVIRAGLAQRSGVDTITVSNEQINSHFAARGVRVQWLRGYQDMVLNNGIADTYPDTVEFIMYPAGTYVVGTSPVIQLDTVYDSVNLKKNDYVHLFLEQGVLMTNPCGDGRRISLPFVANGRRAATSDANDNLFNTPIA